MTTVPLKFLSEAKLAELRGSVSSNLHRYASGHFLDLERENGWAIESSIVRVEIGLFAELDGSQRSAEADVRNSILVHRALGGMTPALAREERVWTRLTHVEGLEYCRARWLSGLEGQDLLKSVANHMFAQGLTGIRDDNALSRLWWNMHIAAIADPADPVGALRLIVKTADIRKQFVERSGSASRRPLARAVVRLMRRNEWITSSESAFRQFMKALNRDGGGVLFEALGPSDADMLMDRCAVRAQIRSGADQENPL
jgi:hypothetical protein